MKYDSFYNAQEIQDLETRLEVLKRRPQLIAARAHIMEQNGFSEEAILAALQVEFGADPVTHHVTQNAVLEAVAGDMLTMGELSKRTGHSSDDLRPLLSDMEKAGVLFSEGKKRGKRYGKPQ